MKTTRTFVLALSLALISLTLAQDYSYEAVSPEEIAFVPSPVEGVENAALIGDQSEEALYVNVGKLAEGVVFPVHTHTDARLSTVISGTMYYGVGEVLDEVEFTAYSAGSVVYTPPNTPHWMWAQDGEVIVQEAGFGPSETTFLENTQ